MSMELNGVNEWFSDEYTNSTCDCAHCLELRNKHVCTCEIDMLRRVSITEQDGDDISFDLVWDDTQRDEPECTCEECHCYDDMDGIIIDLEDELQAAEFSEILAEETESAMIEVLYAFETAEPKEDTLRKIRDLMDLLRGMEFVVASE